MSESKNPSPADREEEFVATEGEKEPKGEVGEAVSRVKDEHKDDDK